MRAGSGFPRSHGQASAHGRHDRGLPSRAHRPPRYRGRADRHHRRVFDYRRSQSPRHRPRVGGQVTEQFFTTWDGGRLDRSRLQFARADRSPDPGKGIHRLRLAVCRVRAAS